MDLDEARRFFTDNHRAVLATFRRDGRPQLSPVGCAVGSGGEIEISSRETAIKVKNLRRDPRAALCGLNDGFYGAWVQVEGTASIDSLPDAMDGLVDLYRRIAGEHPDWDDYRDAMTREQRVIIRVAIERAGPNISG
jgi:PPOX class probable F420-dependent enzyme